MVTKVPADNRGNYYIKNSNGHWILYGRNGRPVYRNGQLQIRRRGTPAWKTIEARANRNSSSNTNNNSSSRNNSSTSTSSTTSTDSESSETKTVSKIEEVPVETYEEAKEYAEHEWGKIRRDDGHTLEVRVFGYIDIKQGKWVKVYIASFDETMYMYVTRVDHSMSSGDEWITSLSLRDYPPSLSQEKEESDTEEDEEEDDESVDAAGDDD